MTKVHLYFVLNLDDRYQPQGMFSIETNVGSFVPVFTTFEAAQQFLMSPFVRKSIEQGSGPKGIIDETSVSFEEWLFRVRMLDRSTMDVAYLLDTDPDWQALAAQLV